MRPIHKPSSLKKKQSGPEHNIVGIKSGDRQFVQGLEGRTLLSAATDIVISPNIIEQSNSSSATYSTSTGYTPAQISDAYGFSSVKFSSGSSTVQGLGQGQTIAIVDAYNDPNIAADLGVFDSKYGLSAPPSLKVVNQSGSSTLPSTDAGWAGEISLDVEWAHALAPDANILLVEANSATLNNLLSAVNYARNAAGVSVVSVSWGGSEFYGETSYDSYFTTPAGHQGVTFVAASGDSGSFYGPEWPAVSPNVLSVGGTTLNLQDSSGTYASETAWSGSTGGTSQLEPLPAYQNVIPSVDTQSYSFSWFGGYSVSSHRSAPDVSFDADPNTGLAVYDSVPYQGQSGWQVVGGTSAGAPSWAALIAIADQGRAIQKQGSLDGSSQTLTDLYSLYSNSSSYSSSFHDVVGGGSFFDSATTGYDQLTGLGSPKAVQIVTTLEGPTATPSPTPSPTTSPTATVSGGPYRRFDLPLPAPGPRITTTTTAFASSPLQTWSAIENQFSLADTAPNHLIPAGVSVLDDNSAIMAGTSIGPSRFNVLETTSSPHDVLATAETGLAQWPANSFQTLFQSSVGLVETTVAAQLPQSVTSIVDADAVSNVSAFFSVPRIDSFLAPLVGGMPARILGLPPAIFGQDVDSDVRTWETAAVTALGISMAGCWYLSAARREHKELDAALRARRVGGGWELSPLEER